MSISEMTQPELVRAFVELGALLTGPRPIAERMSALCAAASQVLRCDHVAVFVLDGDEYRGAYQFGLPPELGERFEDYAAPRDAEIVRRLEASDSYLLINQARQDPMVGRHARAVGVESVIIAAFTHPDGRPFGYFLTSYVDNKLDVSTHEAELATGLARLAQTTLLREFETERRREVSEAMLEVADSERRRLSRDIHDDPLQRILGLRIGLEAFRARVDDDMRPELDRFIDQCRGASESLREVMLRTHPNAAELADLEDVIRSLAERSSFGSQVTLHFSDARAADSPSYLVPAINRVAEQAARNTLRHANATTLTVSLTEQDGGTMLEVEDDGSGFDPAEVDETRLGLVSMRERTQLLGGTFAVRSGPGSGTHVSAWFPHTDVVDETP